MPMPESTSRRRFLGTSAAAAAAPFLLPSRVRAADTSPNEAIQMGFIGMGKQNGGLMNGFIGKSEVNAVAVCDVDTTRREHFKKQAEDRMSKRKNAEGFKGIEAYEDYRELLARDDIDAVCIATPDHWHVPITLAAAAAGKDVYCEKPLTHTAHESIVLLDAFEKNDRVLQTGSMQRSSREFRVAVELVRNGVIGKVKEVYCSFGDPARVCDLKEEEMEPGLDWDGWCGPGPMRGYSSVLSPRGVHNHFPSWRNFIEYGGGMVTDWGAHHLDIAQWGLGRDGSGPVEIIPPSDPKAKRGCKFVYDDGVTLTHQDGKGVEFVGETGRVVCNRGRFELWRGDGDKDYEFISRNQLDQAEEKYLQGDKIEQVYRCTDHKGDFLQRMRDRGKPICDPVVGAGSALVCHLMNISYMQNAHLKWDPENLRFAEGGGDPKWLTKEYRESYPLGA